MAIIKKSESNSAKALSVSHDSTTLYNDGEGLTTKVELNYNMDERIGMRIYQIEYYLFGTTYDMLAQMAASLDKISFGFTFLAQVPSAGYTPLTAGVIDLNQIQRLDYGTAANSKIYFDPVITKNMTDRHPQGLVVHPGSLYSFHHVVEAGSGAFDWSAKLWYEMITLTDSQWDDLWKMIFTQQAL